MTNRSIVTVLQISALALGLALMLPPSRVSAHSECTTLQCEAVFGAGGQQFFVTDNCAVNGSNQCFCPVGPGGLGFQGYSYNDCPNGN